jgi:hypothetical protein
MLYYLMVPQKNQDMNLIRLIWIILSVEKYDFVRLYPNHNSIKIMIDFKF